MYGSLRKERGDQVLSCAQLVQSRAGYLRRPLEEVEQTLDRLDTKAFEGQCSRATSRPDLREIHRIKRRVTSAGACSGALWM